MAPSTRDDRRRASVFSHGVAQGLAGSVKCIEPVAVRTYGEPSIPATLTRIMILSTCRSAARKLSSPELSYS